MPDSRHIVCPRCKAVNNVLSGRETEATCGKCKSALFRPQPIEVDGPTFGRILAKSQVPILTDFWAPWCGPCRGMAPAFADAAKTLYPRIQLVKVNTEQEPEISARYRIQSIPTMILFQGGAEVQRISGAMDARKIAGWAGQYV